MRSSRPRCSRALKCRPPGNRDPLPGEIDACQDYLFRQLELIEPRVVCTLGNFSTKLLRADPATGITRLHGREELRADRAARRAAVPALPPGGGALHAVDARDPARPTSRRIPELLALPAPDQPEPEPSRSSRWSCPSPSRSPEAERAAAEPEPHPAQLGLF